MLLKDQNSIIMLLHLMRKGKMYQKPRGFVSILISLSLLFLLSACQGTTSSGKQASVPTPVPTINGAISLVAHQNGAVTATAQSTGFLAPMIPAGFPHYFSFGVMNSPGGTGELDSLRSQNGAALAFRYQYLTGGVNTAHGWETWNQPAGQFATYYMQESTQHGYIPTFVYYELCQSKDGNAGTNCQEQDLANITNHDTMKAYYANWVLLLQKIAAFGKSVLIIVEPDAWGFLQNAARGTNNAATIPASVASSGYAAAAGYPNTVQGFAWALLHMRDIYAKNALLAIHASCWAAGVDIATDTSAQLDIAGIVRKEADFLNSAGIVGNPAGLSSWNLLSNDVADFDSAQPGGRSWWDRYNHVFPNFSRYLDFINKLGQDTHRRTIMWQVPVGNQYFSTMNNTRGHYQDNRAEYILNHVSDFAASGVIAVLFGPGNGGTTLNDAMHDGVTNAVPINSYECNRCNTHTSTYPDDDGGYLRIFVGQYMRHPLVIG